MLRPHHCQTAFLFCLVFRHVLIEGIAQAREIRNWPIRSREIDLVNVLSVR